MKYLNEKLGELKIKKNLKIMKNSNEILMKNCLNEKSNKIRINEKFKYIYGKLE